MDEISDVVYFDGAVRFSEARVVFHPFLTSQYESLVGSGLESVPEGLVYEGQVNVWEASVVQLVDIDLYVGSNHLLYIDPIDGDDDDDG